MSMPKTPQDLYTLQIHFSAHQVIPNSICTYLAHHELESVVVVVVVIIIIIIIVIYYYYCYYMLVQVCRAVCPANSASE